MSEGGKAARDLTQFFVDQGKSSGREFTPRGRALLAGELERELRTSPPEEAYAKAPVAQEAAARDFVEAAEKIIAGTARDRLGVVAVQNTINGLRAEHSRTKVCRIYPFC